MNNNILIKILLVVSVILNSAALFAQDSDGSAISTVDIKVTGDVIGKITDAETGKKIIGAKVFWEGEDKSPEYPNLEGIYRIRKKMTDSLLIITYPGKVDVEIPASEIIANFWEKNVKMKEKGATSVTASRWEQSVNEIPASIIIVTREEIAQNGYTSLQEIIENVSGMFTVDHRSESDVTFGVRGFWAPFNRNVMIQVNGVSMLSERQNDFPLNKINIAVQSIDKIEIVRGPMSTLYGAGAFFGVINIITNSRNDDNTAILSAGRGTQNAYKAFARYAIQKNGLNLSFNASLYQRDGFKENWDDMVSGSMYDADGFATPNDSTIWTHQGDPINTDRYSKKHHGINLSASYGGFFSNINYAVSDFGFSFIKPGPRDRNAYKSKTLNFQFGYAPLLKRRFNYEAKIAVLNSQTDIEYRYLQPTEYSKDEDRVSTIRSEFNTKTTILDSKINKKYDLDLLIGLSYTNNFENSSFYESPHSNSRNWYAGLMPGTSLETIAGYTQASFKYKGFQLVVGGRFEKQLEYSMLYDKNEDLPYIIDGDTISIYERDSVSGQNESNGNPIPRIGFVQEFKGKEGIKHFVRGVYGQAIKQPTVVDVVGDIIYPNKGLTSDSSGWRAPISAEKISSWELGYTFLHDSINFEMNANLFYNHLDNLVTRQTSLVGTDYVAISKNGGVMNTVGVELILKQSLNFKVKGNDLSLKALLSGTFQRTTQSSTDPESITSPASFSPKLLASGNVFATYTLENELKFGCGIGFNYVGKMNPYFADSSSTTLYDASGIGVVTVTAPQYISYEQQPTNSYFRMSLNFRISDIPLSKKIDGKLYANLKFSNLFNQRYYYPTYTLNPWADKGILGRGFSCLLTAGYTF